MRPATIPRTMTDEPLISRFDALLCDLDGVVYAGPDAIDGGPESLNRAVETGVPVMYVTNNASRPPAAVAEHISELGAPTQESNVASSAQAAAKLLAGRLPEKAKVLITGAQALADEISAVGLTPVWSQSEEPVAVVQGFNPKLGWEQLAEAAYTLADESVLWCATNTDLTIPKERGIAPGNGTLVAAVAAATGREPIVAGKPQAPVFLEAAERANSQRPVVVGDRLDTDIRGAHAAGMESIEVFTGVDTPETVLRACDQERPTYLLGNLRELFEAYPDPQVSREDNSDQEVTATCRDAIAVARDNGVRIQAPENSLDGWRAACAAWWALHPDAETPTDPEVTWEAAR